MLCAQRTGTVTYRASVCILKKREREREIYIYIYMYYVCVCACPRVYDNMPIFMYLCACGVGRSVVSTSDLSDKPERPLRRGPAVSIPKPNQDLNTI